MALLRAAVYAALFIGFVLVFVPYRLLEWSGLTRPERLGPGQILGALMVLAGGALALWCVLAFAFMGRGTPAPFDPPRRLVVRGPYRFARNPMYIGAGLALLGAAVFYWSLPLFGYAVAFGIITDLFVLFYEEPTLKRIFGSEYEEYQSRVNRWIPNRRL
ncbi:MAG: isoprenylcysteine carboxylmethyltransferase family protein [Gemmatimonadetes bacterium]|nr:isoprenylcysteine carboxylmethyltransferase family protein [Gemmatimonadota bacterium]